MRLQKLKIISRYKNLENFEIDFTNKEGITVLIGNNGSGKSNILEAISGIFAGLYDRKFNPQFSYELTYIKDNNIIDIQYANNTYTCKINDIEDNLKAEHLPSQVISSYSGEESRLWDNYYWPFYEEYIKAIRGANIPNSNLVYINKFYWNIALLTLHFYDFNDFSDIKEFCETTLGIRTFNYVKFTFDINKLNDFLNSPNPVTNFILALNPDKEAVIEIDLDEFKTRLKFLSEIEVFRYLTISFMPKVDKIITDIKIDYNTNLDAESLSEGEKKLLLLMVILEVVGDENSLILLDEPDSHIHLSRKQEIQKLLTRYSNRENIITTHSPTLTHSFDLKHITMLTKKENNDVQVETKEKQQIVHELTKGIWSYQEQNIFLNSSNDILLIEGKSDETFLKKALEVLKKTEPRYANLRFEYLPCGGAEGVKLMTKKFTPKVGQHIIALFDADRAGWESINKIFDRSDANKFNSNDFGRFRKQGEIFVAIFPTRPYYKGGDNFNIEDYFRKALLTGYVLKTFKSLDTIVTKANVKKALDTECVNFADHEFKYFKSVFDLILEIKAN
ncbi:MAG: AAA family ATPase [Sediminibacterium sp.]|jgi:ABC-type cobalamin/Fe3+-siderophores transport system ATPase subunit|uniref:ATP-dependent nuclease n=1 Tax=Sediminibacterium sp. TaxID=1917865 RepID=UPI002AB8895B|nr:AAA family ATPase [Sediminibacterium sp.]MDZ4073088.1 AAA family ATPase [Sediminibacterium sp.]